MRLRKFRVNFVKCTHDQLIQKVSISVQLKTYAMPPCNHQTFPLLPKLRFAYDQIRPACVSLSSFQRFIVNGVQTLACQRYRNNLQLTETLQTTVIHTKPFCATFCVTVEQVFYPL